MVNIETMKVETSAGSDFRDGRSFPEMVVLPAGSFMMGSNDHVSELPKKQIEIARPFCMGKFPITFDEYDAFVLANLDQCIDMPNDEGFGRGRRPVYGVSWKDAQAYCDWLSVTTGASYRLPSESEWEYAARAGTQTRYWWGDELKDGVPFFGLLPQGTVQPFGLVGSFKPNPWGIYDLVGSVPQWCQDIHDINNEFTPLDGSPRFSSLTSELVSELVKRLGDPTFHEEKRVRGGRNNFKTGAFEICSVSENRQSVNCDVVTDIGFRVVREI